MLQYNSTFRAVWARINPFIRLLSGLCALLFASAGYAADAPRIVASIKPLQMIAQAVAGDSLQVDRIVPDGANAHDYVLRPSDADKAIHGDLLIWLGPQAETYLARVASRPGLAQFDVSRVAGIKLLPQRRLVEWDEHSADHAHTATFDQHFWLDTSNAAAIADELVKRFSDLDKAHALQYLQNAEAFKLELAHKTEIWNNLLAKEKSHYFIAYHDAYQYLEQQFNVSIATVLTLEPEIKPGAKHLLKVKDAIQEHNVACFVTEPGFDQNLLQKVMPAKAKQIMLDVHGSSVKISTRSYIDLMDGIVKSLSKCLNSPD